MSFITTKSGAHRQVPQSFIDACGLLSGMEGIYDHASSIENAVPLFIIADNVIDEVLLFEQNVPYVQVLDIDDMPETINSFFAGKSARALVDIWRAADYLDYSFLDSAVSSYLANLIRYCEPSRVATLFEIDAVPDANELESFLSRNPFLREN